MKLAKHRDLRTRFKAEGAEWKAEWLAWLWKGDHLPHYMEELIDIHRDVEGDGFMDTDNIASDEIEGDKGEMDADKGKNPLQDPTQPPTSPIPSWFVPPSWWGFIDVYVQHRPAIAVVGPAGNGKTTTVEIALQAHNIPFLALSCTSATEVVDLVGGRILTSEGEEWQDGIVTRAFREGKAVVLDEADTLDPPCDDGVTERFTGCGTRREGAIREHTRWTSLPHRPMPHHPVHEYHGWGRESRLYRTRSIGCRLPRPPNLHPNGLRERGGNPSGTGLPQENRPNHREVGTIHPCENPRRGHDPHPFPPYPAPHRPSGGDIPMGLPPRLRNGILQSGG
jgi:hypothetical protein